MGVIRAGNAANVVTPEAELRAEAHSHDPVFRGRIIRAIEGAFEKAARTVRNIEGERGEVTINGHLDYEAFRLADDEPFVSSWRRRKRFGVAAAAGTGIRSTAG